LTAPATHDAPPVALTHRFRDSLRDRREHPLLQVWAACGLADAACMRLFARTEAQFESARESLLH